MTANKGIMERGAHYDIKRDMLVSKSSIKNGLQSITMITQGCVCAKREETTYP